MYMLSPNGKFEFSFHSVFTFLRTFFLRFLVTGSQLSQCFAVRTSIVFLEKTKTKAQLSVGNFKFVVCWEQKYKRFFHKATFIVWFLDWNFYHTLYFGFLCQKQWPNRVHQSDKTDLQVKGLTNQKNMLVDTVYIKNQLILGFFSWFVLFVCF